MDQYLWTVGVDLVDSGIYGGFSLLPLSSLGMQVTYHRRTLIQKVCVILIGGVSRVSDEGQERVRSLVVVLLNRANNCELPLQQPLV